MTMLDIQRRNSHFIVFLVLFCLQSCYAQNQQVKTFFDDKKKISYEYCIKESEIDKIEKKDENKEVIEFMINGCKERVVIFDNFIDATNTLLDSLPNKEDAIVFNWKKYDIYIPSSTVTVMQTEKTKVIEFTYYDEEKNAYAGSLRRKIYEEKEGKFKNELQYVQAMLKGEKVNNNIARYKSNDYYIVKRINGKYFYYTILNGNLEQIK